MKRKSSSKIKKGDKVTILLGKDRGKVSSVEKVFPKKGKVLVSGVNVYKRHMGKKVTGQEGTILELSKPINISNVILVCPSCNKPTRTSFKISNKIKVRICKKCQKEII